MTEPSKEQQREFWESLGFKHSVSKFHDNGWATDCFLCPICYEIVSVGISENEPAVCCPSIDLNNLFRYAVPKLNWLDKNLLLNEWITDILENNPDPALALFWAIYEVMKDDNAGNAD